MSTASNFFYSAMFPFCASQAGDPYADGITGVDYIDLTPAEAWALFWNGESVSFTPTAITSFFSLSGRSYISPSPDAVNLISYYSTWGGVSEGSEPHFRVCPLSVYTDPNIQPTSPQNISWIYGDAKATFLTLIRYVSGGWRLYYKLIFSTFGDETLFCNPQYAIDNNLATSGYSNLASGSIIVFGQTLSWEIWANLGQTLTSSSFTAYSVSWTY